MQDELERVHLPWFDIVTIEPDEESTIYEDENESPSTQSSGGSFDEHVKAIILG
jgi:hypothetical protein